MEEILITIFEEFVWFLKLKEKYPERFFYYFENGFDKNVILRLAEFLKIEPENEWRQNVLAAFEVKSNYKHGSDLVDFYNKNVSNMFSAYPEFLQKLSEFTLGLV